MTDNSALILFFCDSIEKDDLGGDKKDRVGENQVRARVDGSSRENIRCVLLVSNLRTRCFRMHRSRHPCIHVHKKMHVSTTDPLKVNKGQMTLDAEGNDNAGSKYFSRKAHVPS